MKILLVDDEKNIRQTLTVSLKGLGHDVVAASSAEEALQLLKSQRFDFMLTDYRMGGKSGIDLIRGAKGLDHPPITVIMTAYASFDNAVTAIKEGAYDYIAKPFSNQQLGHLLEKVGKMVELRRENEQLRSQSFRSDYFSAQSSPAMQRLEEFIRKVAPTDASVLLVGESGTGKTELAKLIHARSDRSARPFVVVNCATLTETLLESELFGHVRGAFTGAVQDHVGKLELANRGTVLIDEIGDLSLNGQARLLRFLQEKVIERVGGTAPIVLDVRVIAATNRNLEEAVKDGRFREDLYYRLNMFESSVVPLRHRMDDVPVLIQKFLREVLLSNHESQDKEIPDSVMKKLLAHSWPGNIRELKNTIERLVLLSRGRSILEDDLPDSIRISQHPKRDTQSVRLISLSDVEREHIEGVLSMEHNQERAAEILGITTVTLWRKRKQYGLP